jgi:hypothetical protein
MTSATTGQNAGTPKLERLNAVGGRHGATAVSTSPRNTNGTAVAAVHPQIRHYGQSLSQHECDKHRAWIGIRIEALLDGYWQARPSDAVKAEMMADWMSALETFDPDEIRAACREYLSGPDCRTKPKPGDIRKICLKARAAAMPPRRSDPEPDRRPISEERRKETAAIFEQTISELRGKLRAKNA